MRSLRRICHSAESEIWNVHIASNIKPSPWARATSPPENFLFFVVGRSTTAYSPGCNSEAGDTLYFPAASFSAWVDTRSSRKCEYICQSAAGLDRTSALPCVAPTILQVFCAGVSFTIAGSYSSAVTPIAREKSSEKLGVRVWRTLVEAGFGTPQT